MSTGLCDKSREAYFVSRVHAGWTAVNMGVFFGALKMLGLFRVSAKDEEEGLDHSYHGGSAYGEMNGEYKPTYSKVRI